MDNILPVEKKITIVAALTEGCSIRGIERMTGVHRDTIMRLGVRMGEGCQRLMDEKLVNLPCKVIEVDEIWGFIGMKQKIANKNLKWSVAGDVWTWVALDAETKLVPTYAVGKRTNAMANDFIEDLSKRLSHRVQISTDAFAAYKQAIAGAFGNDVDYASIVKVFKHPSAGDERRYSPAEVIGVKKEPVVGNPDMSLCSTSYVEKQNHTLRMHCRRLSRLTNAFSKKLENFKAAVGLHYAYYNFCKTHKTMRTAPAVAAGVINSAWTVRDLVEMVGV